MGRDLVRKFSKVVLQRIPRLENEEADRLARIASSERLVLEVPLKTLDSPSIRTPEVNVLQTQASWAKPIRDYMEHNILPEDKLEASRIKFRASRYVVFDGVSYKWGHTIPLHRCVTEEEAIYIMRKVHEGICDNHSGGQSLANKILRTAYYWPTMSRDSQKFVK